MTIASELLTQTLLAVKAHEAQLSQRDDRPCVEQVEVEIGLMRLVVPEALEMAWQVVCEGTIAQGARLSVTEMPLSARCRLCGRTYEPSIDNYQCPQCNEADMDICAGNDIILKTVTCRLCEG